MRENRRQGCITHTGKTGGGGEEERGKRSEKGERRQGRKGWPAVARRSVEVAGAERGEFQRRDVSTEFQSKKDARFGTRYTSSPWRNCTGYFGRT